MSETEGTRVPELNEFIDNVHAAMPYVLLKPEDIKVTEDTNVRPFSTGQGQSEGDISAIQNLMGSIEEVGQLQPVTVVRVTDAVDGEPGFELIAGRRRLAAITMHNLAADEKDQLLVKATVADAMKAPQKFRSAAHENILRENISPIDFAFNIKTLRKKGKLEGKNGTKKVAEYFRVSPATITQHEKLLDLSDEMQRAIHEGTISRDAAFVLADPKVPADKRQQVLDAAVRLQQGEIASAGDAEAEAAVNAPKKAGKGKKSGAAGKGGVKAKHVRAAAREVVDAVQPRSKKEIVEFFEANLGPAYGYPDGAVHQFINNFIKWVKGDLTDRTLVKYWDAMVADAPQGTAASVMGEGKTSKKKK